MAAAPVPSNVSSARPPNVHSLHARTPFSILHARVYLWNKALFEKFVNLFCTTLQQNTVSHVCVPYREQPRELLQITCHCHAITSYVSTFIFQSRDQILTSKWNNFSIFSQEEMTLSERPYHTLSACAALRRFASFGL